MYLFARPFYKVNAVMAWPVKCITRKFHRLEVKRVKRRALSWRETGKNHRFNPTRVLGRIVLVLMV